MAHEQLTTPSILPVQFSFFVSYCFVFFLILLLQSRKASFLSLYFYYSEKSISNRFFICWIPTLFTFKFRTAVNNHFPVQLTIFNSSLHRILHTNRPCLNDSLWSPLRQWLRTRPNYVGRFHCCHHDPLLHLKYFKGVLAANIPHSRSWDLQRKPFPLHLSYFYGTQEAADLHCALALICSVYSCWLLLGILNFSSKCCENNCSFPWGAMIF